MNSEQRSGSWRVVVVDDSPDDRAEIRRMLLRGSDRKFDFLEAENGSQALTACLNPVDGPPDCTIIDYNLPDCNAEELLTSLAGADGHVVCPVVVVTGSMGHQHSLGVLQAGAQDYLGKSWMTPESMTRAVENAVARWETERRLRERERFLQRMADVTPGVLHVFDVEERRSVFINRSVASLLGYEPDEIRSMGTEVICDLMHPDDRPRFEQHIARVRAMRNEEASEFEYRMRDRNGEWHWFQSRDAVFDRGAGGKVRLLIGAAVDITPRKRVESKLRENEERLRIAAEVAELAVAEIDYENDTVRLSPEAADLFGLPAEPSVVSRASIQGLVHPDDRAELAARVAAAYDPAGLGQFAMNHRIVRPDGQVRWHSVKKQVFFDDGRPVRALLAMFDITDRMVAERALAESEYNFRSLFEASGAGNAEIDITDGRFVRVNRSYCELTGYKAEELIGGLTFLDITHPDDRTENIKLIKPFMSDIGDQFEIESRYVRKDGRVVWVHLNGTLLRDAAGRPTRLLASVYDVTVRKEAEDLLRRNHDTFYALIQNNPFGLYIVDADFRLREVSAGAQKVFSAVRPLLGRDFAEVLRLLWPEPFASEAITRFRRTLATGEPYVSPSTVERRQDIGETEAYDWRIERILLPDGRHGVVCHFYDLSERRRWEAAILEKERELQAIADNTPDILTRFDQELRHTFVNLTVEKITGRSRDAFIGRTNRELGMPGPLCDLWEAKLRAVFASGRPESVEFTFDCPDGNRHFAGRLVPEFDAQGNVESVLGVTRDETDRLQAEAALRASEERLARAQRAANVGTWDWDIQTGQANWTDEAWALFGRHSNDGPVTYDFWISCIHPDDRTSASAANAAALMGAKYDDEFRVLHPDGAVLWLRSIGEVVRDADRPVRMLGTVQNITERKNYEDALRDADRRKDEFLAMLAHELRNPMAAISSAVHLLMDSQKVPDLVGEISAMLQRQTEQMNRLIEDLLDVSRISRGKIELRKQRVDLNEIVEKAVEAAHPICQKMGHELVVSPSKTPIHVDGDSARLIQVIGNLLNNSCKFTDPGGRLTLSVERQGDVALVRITDNGIGIAPAQLPKIFGLFSQADTSLHRPQAGLGIGLSLVKSLTEMHGGAVNAHSRGIGFGSEFTVRLPALSEAAPPVSVRSAPPIDAAVKAKHRVLVVDDNVDAARALALLLKLDGHQIQVAHDGEEAIVKAEVFNPHIVLLDIGLPKIDGYEVCRRIRRRPSRRNPVVIALTGWGQEEDRIKTKDAGFDAHVVKPIDLNRLKALITEFQDQSEPN